MYGHFKLVKLWCQVAILRRAINTCVLAGLIGFVQTVLFAQTTYYVSSIGSDQNDGKADSSPFQTLNKINLLKLQPGDQVLFRRGDIFAGQLNLSYSGSTGTPIVIGAYGAGPNRPVISGTVPLSGWSNYRGGVLRCPIPSKQTIRNLFCDGRQMTVARYPNVGFLTAEQIAGNAIICTAGLQQNSDYWAGATMRIRSTYWSFETRKVTSSVPGQVTLEQKTEYPLAAGWGFFLDGKLDELDSPGEWFNDTVNSQAYLFPPAGVDPNSASIEGSAFDYGINGVYHLSNVIVRDLAFNGQAKSAIRFPGATNNIKIEENLIRCSFLSGIDMVGSSPSNCVIINNQIADVNGIGIRLSGHQGTDVSNNVIRRIGLFSGYGETGTNGMIAILSAGGAYNSFSGNTIDSTGYIGIRADGQYNLVERNLLTNTVLKLNDGGAIYCWGLNSSHSTWKNNIIRGVIGNLEGTPPKSGKIAVGLYLDGGTNNMTIDHNTIAGVVSHGIMTLGSRGNNITGNLVYGSGKSQIEIMHDSSIAGGGNSIRRNILYALSYDQRLLRILGPTPVGLDILDSNYYCNPYDYYVAEFINSSSKDAATKYTLADWIATSGQDKHSSKSAVHLDSHRVIDTTGQTMIQNGDFSTSLVGWKKWPVSASISVVTNAELDGPALQLSASASPTDKDLSFMASSDPWSLQDNQGYLVSFIARSPIPGTLSVRFTQNHSPYATIGFTREVPVGPTKNEYSFVFMSDTSDTQTRLDFVMKETDSLVWIDNASIRPVEVLADAPTERSPLFINYTGSTQSVPLTGSAYFRLDGSPAGGRVTLPPYSSTVLVSLPGDATKTGAPRGEIIPLHFGIDQNYPNPFNPSTIIRYGIPTGERVRVEVYTITGQRLAVLVDEYQPPGYHSVVFKPSRIASGVYFYRMEAGQFSAIKKMLFVQ